MDPITIGIIGGLAANYFANFTTPVIQNLFEQVFKRKPSLEDELRKATTLTDYERIFQEAVGVIDANAGTGDMQVDGGLLTAIRGIKFNHQNGSVTIQGTTIKAPVIVTGGGAGSTGKTHLGGDTTLRSGGTKIEIGKGASIQMSGDASIKQG